MGSEGFEVLPDIQGVRRRSVRNRRGQ